MTAVAKTYATRIALYFQKRSRSSVRQRDNRRSIHMMSSVSTKPTSAIGVTPAPDLVAAVAYLA
jgi:hypothetical protein